MSHLRRVTYVVFNIETSKMLDGSQSVKDSKNMEEKFKDC
jgi:hypothetical protein